MFGDLRRAEGLREHGPFDLVFFLGVLYHSAFHLELLGMLNRVTRLGGEMLLETTTDPRPDSAVRVRWQPGTGKAKMVPTFDALRIELAWTGWRDVDGVHRLPARVRRGAAALPEDRRARRQRRRRGRRPASARPAPRRELARSRRGSRSQGSLLAAITLWGSLGQQLDVPTVFGDELIHWDASRSLASGDGLRGPQRRLRIRARLTRVLIAPVHLLAGDDLSAYGWARLVNAVLFAFAAIPAYLLARRLLPRDWSVACAGLAVLIPSALYTGFVMTEGAAYAASTLALLAFARCLERPTVPAQLLAVTALLLAAGVRLQLATLGGAFALALLGRTLLTRGLRLPTRRDVVRLWPLSSCLWAARSRSPSARRSGTPSRATQTCGARTTSSRWGRWTWRALAGLGLYLALVPLVVVPTVLAALAREGRAGSRPSAALVPLFLAVNLVLLLVVGAFSSTEFGIGYLHDRYLFYVVPLWIVATAVWAERRLALGPLGLAAGALLVLAPLATLPTYLLNADGGRRFDAIVSALPSEVALHAGRPQPERWWLIGAGLLALALVLGLTRTRLPAWIVLVPVAVVFALDAGFAWDARIEAAENITFAPLNAATASWVDRAVPEGAEVATLVGKVPVETRDALRLTEFFNGSIGPAYAFGDGYAPTLAADTCGSRPAARSSPTSGAPARSGSSRRARWISSATWWPRDRSSASGSGGSRTRARRRRDGSVRRRARRTWKRRRSSPAPARARSRWSRRRSSST